MNHKTKEMFLIRCSGESFRTPSYEAAVEKSEIKIIRRRLFLICLALVVFGAASSSYADVIGNWEDSSGDGWVDYSNGESIADAINADTYSFLSGSTGATLGDYSLKVTPPAAWTQCLRISLETKVGAKADFLAHTKFRIDVTYNSADWPSDTNYAQVYELSINASGYGWNDVGGANDPNGANGVVFTDTLNPSNPGQLPLVNPGVPGTTLTGTWTWDYSGIKSQITATPSSGYIHFVFALNSDKAGAYYFDNARFVMVENSSTAQDPSPADGARHVGLTPTLTWTAGTWVQDVNGHDVYLGTDYDEVDDATTATAGIYLGSTTEPNYQILTDLTGVDYYWRVDEVNDANADSPWKGDVWHFTTTNAPPPVPPPQLHVDGNKIKDPNGDVVVLRGVSLIDLGATEQWYDGATEAIDRVTNKDDPNGDSPGWYTEIIRIPVCPHKSPLFTSSPLTFNPDDVNDPTNEVFYDLLRDTIDYCAEKKIYAIIDWHDMNDTDGRVDDTSTFWEFIAPRFADDSHVLFELFNEPENPGATEAERWESVRDDMQTWVDIVRTYAPHNLILVGAPHYDQILGPVVDNPINDSNIVYVSHLYPIHWLGEHTGGDNSYYLNHITTCAAVYPVICTEWGFWDAPLTDSNFFRGTITNYGDPLKEFLEEYGIGNTAWCVHNGAWKSPMFDGDDWTLRCGEAEMGCFTKDWLYEKNGMDTIALTVTKCKVKAGKIQGQDSFYIFGTFSTAPDDYDDVNQVTVDITSLADEEVIYSETMDFNASTNVVRNTYRHKYKIPRGEPGAITSLKMSFTRKNIKIIAKKIDLTGLAGSLRLDVTIGSYILSGEVDEDIVNGSRKTIPTRLMRTYQDTLIVTKAKARNSSRSLSDSLFAKGEIAVEDINDSEPNLVAEDVVITWSDANDVNVQTFTIPAGSFTVKPGTSYYKCSKITADEGGLVTAKIDLYKCKFTVKVKATDLDVVSGDAKFGLSFADSGFDETDEVDL